MFQNEKQMKLNELETVVVLKLRQIQCLAGPDTNKMPLNMKNLVVFTNHGLKALHSRILDLFHEKKTLNKDFQDLRRKHVALTKVRKEKQTDVQNWEVCACSFSPKSWICPDRLGFSCYRQDFPRSAMSRLSGKKRGRLGDIKGMGGH